METLRVRLVFEDRNILNNLQRLDGLMRSWLLFKPEQHKTISDLSSHLLHIFDLHHSCPNGVLLSMEGFVLPPFESTCLLKDKEIICIKRKGGTLSDAIEAGDAAALLDEVEIVEKQPVDTGLLLLANEEFDKETGGYESESEEDKEDQLEDAPIFENSSGAAVSKKRKASAKLQGSKKKKHRLVVPDGVEDEVQTQEIDNCHNDGPLTKKSTCKKEKVSDVKNKSNVASSPERAEISNKKVDSPTNARSDQLQENDQEVELASPAPAGTKKVPSRSARRKKAKRRWLREVAKISKKKPNSKPEPAKAENKEVVGHSKGLLHWKQMPKKPVHKNRIEKEETNPNGDADTDVVPIVIRPGHIRFEPLEEEEAAKETQVSNEAFEWNGITSKKKGQKWGTEKFSSARWNDSEDTAKKEEALGWNGMNSKKKGQKWGTENFSSSRWTDSGDTTKKEEPEANQWNGIMSKKKGQKWGTEKLSSVRRNDTADINKEFSKVLITGKEVPVNNLIDFDKLPPLCSSPKEADVIAYRLLELSSSWTPELSSFRVGKISSYSVDTCKIVLMPVPEYPIVSEKIDEDGPDNSLYGEDGILETKFSSLVDVRIVKQTDSGPAKAVSSGVNQTPPVRNGATESAVPSSTVNKAHVTSKGNGEVNLWDQFSETLNAKKAELSEDNNWTKAISKRDPWSYRALRGSALGPTMAMLRSKNNI